MDVIFHPWVLLHTSQDNFFKTSVTELAFACIEEELGMAVKKVRMAPSVPCLQQECVCQVLDDT